MADLLASQTGLETLNRIACFLGRRRMSRNLVRSFYIAFHEWQQSGYFNKTTLLNDLNELTQDELVDLNTLLGELGCYESTQEVMTIYVDPTNGSDVSGDGSATYPYASLSFLDTFPREIDHNVRVMLLSDLDMGVDPLNLNFTVGPNGCFSLIGRAAPTTVTTSAGAGPFTVTAVTSRGTAPTSDYAHELTFADTWGVDELYGKWLRFESGTNQGEVFQIHTNAANMITIRGGCLANPQIGDTVSIIEPTITLNCQRINLEMTGPENNYKNTYDSSRLNIMNLNIDMTGTYTESDHFVLKSSIQSQISFVTLITDNDMPDAVVLKSRLNQYPSSDVDIATYTLTTISNIDAIDVTVSACGILMYNSDFLPPDLTFNSLVIDGPDIVRCIDTRGLVRIMGNVRDLNLCAFGLVIGYRSPACGFSRNIVNAEASSHSISLIHCGYWGISSVHFPSSGLNLFNLQGIILSLNLVNITFGVGVLYTGFGFQYSLAGLSQVVVNSSTGGIASTNAIHFAGGVGTTAFPGPNLQATDALGSTFNVIITP